MRESGGGGRGAALLCAAALASPSHGAESPPPPTILSTAVAAAEKVAIPRLPKEENLTAQSAQLTELAALLVRAGRFEVALRLVEDLETEDRTRVPAYVPLAVAAIRAGDTARARTLTRRVSTFDEWTTPVALADIALAFHAAGDEPSAVRLAGEITNPAEQTRALVGMGRSEEALPPAAAIAPSNVHVPWGGGSRWELDYDARLTALLELVKAFVDRGDLPAAHRAMDAIAQVADRDTHAYQARALLEIARREETVPTLRKALEHVGLARGGRAGERRDSAELLARIAEALAAAGERSLAVPLLHEAVAMVGPIEKVGDLEMCLRIVSETLARIARAHLALDERQQALALLDRAARLAGNLPVPAPPRKGDLGWDKPSALRQDKVESLARVAAVLELAGETRKAEEVLGRALSGIDAIPSSEWREYAWRAVVQAYVDAGRLDRALDVLAAGRPANPEKLLAFSVVPDDALLAAGHDRRRRLLDAMAPSWSKVDLEARLASRLENAGDPAEAALLVVDALAAATHEEGWEWCLIRLATLAPGVDRPGSDEEQRLLRQLLARLPR